MTQYRLKRFKGNEHGHPRAERKSKVVRVQGTKGEELACKRPDHGEGKDCGNGCEHRGQGPVRRRSAVSSEALNERLTRMRLTIATTSEKEANARTSCSGMPDLSAMTKMAATRANAKAPCSRLQAINAPENKGYRERGGRRMTSSSSVSASTREQTGSMTISRKAIWMGPNKIGRPNSSGNSARPAMGT